MRTKTEPKAEFLSPEWVMAEMKKAWEEGQKRRREFDAKKRRVESELSATVRKGRNDPI